MTRAASILFGLLVLPAALGAQQRPAPAVRPRTAAEDMQLFSQVFNQLRINHPDSLESHRLFRAAIQAMVQAADPHSHVVWAYRLDAQKSELLRRGRLFPVPINFTFIGGSAIVVSVSAGTRASRQDILVGDELSAIDGNPMTAESAFELDAMLSGTRGSTVKLTFERRRADGTWATHEREVTRERITDAEAVAAAMMLDSITGYVRITTFDDEDVSDELRAAVQRLDRGGMQRLVLDLRQNGGGLLGEAADIAGEFLPSGATVYTSAGRRASSIDTGRVARSFFSAERRYPMVVMIDEGTASASELVAGALQDHDRAIIVGRPSFGKSLMMQGFPLSDGSALNLVIGSVRTPCGREVQRRYRDVSVRNYYRLAGAERDTAGRPSCTTAGGRVVYGGGGIYPDVRLARPAQAPEWARRLYELDVPLAWVGGFLAAAGTGIGSLESFERAPVLPPSATDGFRQLAAERGVEIPRSAAADSVVNGMLLDVVAYAKWGDRGLYRLGARRDPEIAKAVEAFGAIELPRGRR